MTSYPIWVFISFLSDIIIITPDITKQPPIKIETNISPIIPPKGLELV